jgi:hypothetical protein
VRQVVVRDPGGAEDELAAALVDEVRDELLAGELAPRQVFVVLEHLVSGAHLDGVELGLLLRALALVEGLEAA